jgi:S-adenosylmethionine hydrolase
MITLSSDFGSPYPGAMRGVILQTTDARLVDVSHEFLRQDVRGAAFWLTQLLPYYPPAVHLVVVDPGVGTDRDAVVVRAGNHALVGPDNGVLLPVARELGDDIELFRVVETDDEHPPHDSGTKAVPWPPNPESSTFHGRDVFAPAAARVHEAGIDTFEADPGFEPTDDYEDLSFPEPTVREGAISGTVLAVDDFGNVITNIPGDHIEDRMGDSVEVNAVRAPICRTYDEVDDGRRVVTVGSHGNVELAANRDRGDRTFGIGMGETVTLTW